MADFFYSWAFKELDDDDGEEVNCDYYQKWIICYGLLYAEMQQCMDGTLPAATGTVIAGEIFHRAFIAEPCCHRVVNE